MKVKASGLFVLPGMIAGAWKFRCTGGNSTVSVEELAKTAQELVNQNPGGGTFHQVYIRNTARDELGICFMYEPSPNESVNTDGKEWKEVYTDFFFRRHGTAYKGCDFGNNVTEIVLQKQ